MKRLSTRLVSAIGLAVFALAPPAYADDAPPTDASPSCTTYVEDGGMVVDGGDGSEGFEGDPDIYVDPMPDGSGEYVEEPWIEAEPGDGYVEEGPADEVPAEDDPGEEYVEEVPAEEYPPSDEPVCYEVIPVEPCDTCEAYATDGHDETTGAPVAAESGPVSAPAEPGSATVDEVTPVVVNPPGVATPPAADPEAAAPVAAPVAAPAPAADVPATAAVAAGPGAALDRAVTEVEVEPISDEVPVIQASNSDGAAGQGLWLVTLALVLGGAAAVGAWLRFRTR